METKAYSIDQFCEVHGFGRTAYYNLKRDGLGPREIHVGTKPLVTEESAKDWRAQMEARASNETDKDKVA